jgi:hypothetical protein
MKRAAATIWALVAVILTAALIHSWGQPAKQTWDTPEPLPTSDSKTDHAIAVTAKPCGQTIPHDASISRESMIAGMASAYLFSLEGFKPMWKSRAHKSTALCALSSRNEYRNVRAHSVIREKAGRAWICLA